MPGPRVFFHVQHLLGIGHLRRAAILCRAAAQAGCEVTLASGGPPLPGLALEGVKLVQLPPMSAADATFSALLDAQGRPIDDAWRSRRAAALLEAWRAARAEVLVIELFPFGRRQLRFELEPLLAAARGVRVLCSVRDLLQRKPVREAEVAALVERDFERVLVHGDPRVARFEESFGAAPRIAAKLAYTGYVVEPLPAAHGAAGRGEVLVSAGGGAVGRRLLETAIRARPLTRLRERTWRVLCGIHAPEADLQAMKEIAGAGVVVERARQDFTTLLRNCELSVSQAGYNTVMETLQAGARAVVIPFAQGNETEQGLRARLLAARGLLEHLEERELTSERLAAAIDRAAARPRPTSLQMEPAVDLDGARKSAALIRGEAA